jgi:hypothetical protein
MHQSVISRTSSAGSTGYQAQSQVLPDFGGVNGGRDKINIAVGRRWPEQSKRVKKNSNRRITGPPTAG